VTVKGHMGIKGAVDGSQKSAHPVVLIFASLRDVIMPGHLPYRLVVSSGKLGVSLERLARVTSPTEAAASWKRKRTIRSYFNGCGVLSRRQERGS
jgi:hypothetical protein